MQLGLHPQKLLSLAFKHPFHRNTRPLCHNFSNILRRNSFGNDRVLDRCLLCRQFVNLLFGICHLSVTDLGHLSIVACPLGILGLYPVVLNLLTRLLKP